MELELCVCSYNIYTCSGIWVQLSGKSYRVKCDMWPGTWRTCRYFCSRVSM